MYAVVTEGAVVYLGPCPGLAKQVAEDYSDELLGEVATVVEVVNLDELAAAMNPPETDKVADLVEKGVVLLDSLVEKLDKLGVNKDLADKVRTNSEKVVAEVKTLGVNGMKAVGEGFVALGDLLRKAEGKGCGKPDCCQNKPGFAPGTDE
jgi:hypothetical protein